jgi:hypothetical protein
MNPRLAWLRRGTLSLRPWLALSFVALLAVLAAASFQLFALVRAERSKLRLAERAAAAAIDLQQQQLEQCLAQLPARPPEKP